MGKGHSSSRGTTKDIHRANRRGTGSVRDKVTPRLNEEQNASVGPQQQPPPQAEQMPLTQGDIPKIVELIVRQLPVTSNTTSNSTQVLAAGTQHMPSLLISNQAPLIAIPTTSSTPGAGGSTLLTLMGIPGTTPTALPPMKNSSTGDGGGNVVGASVQLLLTVPGT